MEKAQLLLISACAILLVLRIVFPPEPPPPPPPPPPPQPVAVEAALWQQFVSTGHRIGSPTAPVELVVFADFECPACRRFATVTWPTLHERYPDQVAMVFQHWPLDYHQQARPAARAAECAAAQGAFTAFHDRLFAQQDSLGRKSWTAFARESGVADVAAFGRCTAETDSLPTVEAGVAWAREIGGRGTPTVLINGYRWPTIPSVAEIEQVVRRNGVMDLEEIARITDSSARARRAGQGEGPPTGSPAR